MVDSLLERYWSELKGQIRERWGKLTADDVDQIGGKIGELIARVQGR